MTEADKDTLHLIIFVGFVLWSLLGGYWAYKNPLPHRCLQDPPNPKCTAESECEDCWWDTRVP